MDCIALIFKYMLLGAIISSKPHGTIGVFVYKPTGKTFLAKDGDVIAPGLTLVKIEQKSRSQFMCGGVLIRQTMFNYETNYEEQPEPENYGPEPEPYEYREESHDEY